LVEGLATLPLELVERVEKAVKDSISVSVSVICKFSYAPKSQRRQKHDRPPHQKQSTKHVVESHSENVLSKLPLFSIGFIFGWIAGWLPNAKAIWCWCHA
jgi:hypothetical protein